MNSGRFQKLLNKISGLLFLFAVLVFLSGCSDENKTSTPAVTPKPKKLMSRETQLSPSLEEKMSIAIKDPVPSKKELEKILRDHFGINSILTSGERIILTFNPVVITPDSIKIILRKNNIHLK